MSAFAVGSQAQWCAACGNTTGVCASSLSGSSGSDNSTGTGQDPGTAAGGGGMSNAVAGVVGAMVTLAVVLLVAGLVLLLGGLRLVSKKRLAASPAGSATGVKA